MTQDLTKARASNAVDLSLPPTMSADLSVKLKNLRNGTTEGTEAFRPEYPIGLIDEAKVVLAEMDRRMAPASANLIELWLRRLRSACAPISGEEFFDRVEMIKFQSGDLPAWAWSKDALHGAINQFSTFFPTAGDFDKFLRPRCSPMNHTRYFLQHVAGAKVKELPSPEDSVPLAPLVLPPGMRSRRESV